MMRGYGIGLVTAVGLLGWGALWPINLYPTFPSLPDLQIISNLTDQASRISGSTRTALRQTLLEETHLKDHLLFEETFEGMEPLATAVNLQTYSEHSFRIAPDPVNTKNKAGRFELRVSDDLIHRGKRSELFIIDRVTDKEMWYSFAVLFPEDGYAPDSTNELISQWHQGGSPPISLRTVDDVIYLRLRHSTNPAKWKVLEIAPLTKDVWHEFVFHIIHSAGSDALLEVWHNGEKRVNYSGPNHFEDKNMPYWKVGVYKAKWNHNRTASDTRVLYFDNIRAGNHLASYETMKPAG